MLALALLLIAVMIGSIAVNHASAQTIPIPPPSPESNDSAGNTRVAKNDRTAPEIEILTTELYEGKNVFRVRITDESSIQAREVKYVENGQLKVTGLFRDRNDVYRALIDIHWPSRIVEVTVTDAAGNMAKTYREYDIQNQPDIFSQIINMLLQIPEFFQNMFGNLSRP